MTETDKSAALWRRIWHMVTRGVLSLPPNDTGPAQVLQVKLSDIATRDGVPLLQQFGFSSVLPVGTDVVVLSMTGDRTNAIAIATNNEGLRPKGNKPGETLVFDAFGNVIHLQAGKIAITSPLVTISGDLQVNGEVVAHAQGGAVHLTTHKHSGVQTGAGNTAAPVPGT